jgi:pimeloyl-ACP methyl ester carboxylesterase
MTNAQSLKTRDGCRLVYEVKGEGPPLLLIHGWTFDRTMWSPQVPELSQYFTTITYDRRGCGESGSKPDLREELNDLNDLLDHLAIDSSYILGMSQGGRIALRYSMNHPDRIKAIILQGTALDGYVPNSNQKDQIPLDHYSRLAIEGRMDRVRDEWMNHPLMQLPTSNSSLKKQVRKIINRYSGEDLTEDMMEHMTFPINISHNLPQITMPTLIIEGNEEIPLLKDVAIKLLEDIQDSNKIVITGGGHLINLIEPEKYNQAVIDFLRSLNHI